MDKGAHFHRADLQVHTPRDTNWSGDDHVSDEERRKYATALVAACREKGLQAIAITDHHDMAFVPFVRAAAEEETDEDGRSLKKEDRLIVFPGMELTLGVPCQALLIFDAELPADLFPLAMTALTIAPSPATESKIAPVARLESIQSLKQLKDKLDEHQFLRERFIVFPHVGENGDFSLIRKGMAGKYIEMPCVGGFVDGELQKLGTGTANIVAGKAKEWGNKRIACFQTSDNRREDHEDLGRVSTWIKWATPTAEALRQACLAQESRVSQEEPRIPAVAVGAISVSNSSFLGPIDLECNPQYNALIGGRGTGKSTILEYLRWALCDQPPGLVDDEIPNYQARRHRLIEHTLRGVNGTVEVRFEVNDVPHVVRRDSQGGDLLLKVGSDDMRSCSEEEVRRLLPIQAYSQKQLSDVSVRLEELARFITAPIRADLEKMDGLVADRSGRIRETYATVRRCRALNKSLEERELEEKSLSEQAQKLRDGLTGLSDEDRALLEEGKVYSSANQAVDSWRDGARRLKEDAESLHATVVSLQSGLKPPPAEPDADILRAAHQEYEVLLGDAAAGLDAIIAKTALTTEDPASLDSTSPWRKWFEKRREFQAAYDAAVKRSSAHKEKMDSLKKIELLLEEHVRETARLKEELRALAGAEEAYQSEREAWEGLLRDREAALTAQCAKLTNDSEGAIRAQLKPYADTKGFISELKQAVSGSRVPGARIESLAAAISQSETAEEAADTWKNILRDLERLAEFDPERDGAERRPNTPELAAAGLTPANLDGIGRSLQIDDWLALSLTQIRAEPVFEYRAREMDYIPFRNASAGQQATALLKTLLSQSGPPLIIDQPEEDLDNPVILEVVERLWKAKQKRQLIFASHNANLVVNGDAELVAWCDYRTAGDQSRGMIAGEGAIDVDETRDAIKRIMEGGEAAFTLRKEKYGF